MIEEWQGDKPYRRGVVVKDGICFWKALAPSHGVKPGTPDQSWRCLGTVAWNLEEAHGQ